jgi:GAF domain-containing protein
MAVREHLLSLARRLNDGECDSVTFLHALTREITAQMHCSRASFWVYEDSSRSAIRQVCGYDARTDAHQSGLVLRADDYAPYFAAIQGDGLVVASEARLHPATACFNDNYHAPNDIRSLLDVGIAFNGLPLGLFCCEHTGDIRRWTPMDIKFLRETGSLIGKALHRAALDDRAAA